MISPFFILEHRRDEFIHTGFDYEDQILKKSMSKEMFRSNSLFVGFLEKIDRIIYQLIEGVKYIKSFSNIAIDKNEKNII